MQSDRRIHKHWTALLVLAATWPCTSRAATDLTDLSLEDLLDVKVTSVGKKAQALADAAAAVYVIGNDEIRRSGATSVPEALRMVPGITVKRLDANKWSVSARGFGGRLSNKLLVLIDGRTVYSPTFSGVYWEQQDVMLEDIDRIEVIRGPGATLWGANAVNGVINIISKPAAATQGTLVVAGGGTEERVIGAARQGVQLSPETFARAYVKYNDRDSLVTPSGLDGRDSWDIMQGGFRLDSRLAGGDRLTFQGDLYRSSLGQQLLVPDPFAPPSFVAAVDDDLSASGWNLLGRWDRALSLTSDISLKLFYDHSERHEYYAGQRNDIVDLEFQQRTRLGDSHDLVWGLGYRGIDDRFEISRLITVDPIAENRSLWNAFVQDDIELLRDRLRLTLGTKVEHNDYTGFEIQPNIRLLWKVSEQASLWGAVSRAVRTPSRVERSGTSTLTSVQSISTPLSTLLLVPEVTGAEDFDAEALTAYELGFRTTPSPRLSADLALFVNDYDSLRTVDTSDAELVWETLSNGYLVSALPISNQGRGQSYGLEFALDYRVRDDWTLALAYSYLELDIQVPKNGQDPENDILARTDPRQQLSLRSQLSPRPDLDIDAWLRYVDQSDSSFVFGAPGDSVIPSYWELDLRLAWRPRPKLELSIVGQNLLHDSHQEGYQDIYGLTQFAVQRGVYGLIRIAF
ncbi:TonB-dependent receptor plug domain-containing protein [Thiocystis violacea]|uniref:TonB-dependent receptor plug domain-containing protein n=1 Tax=Thiocystis violacea TaxID=13725 RepID=UPI001903BB49|nr:TonB-dependent receptor [Thiocystis violacea]MBK1716138.1 TonB-dependent receptor [Thiocystis violacea]